jgi:hypothetical protein
MSGIVTVMLHSVLLSIPSFLSSHPFFSTYSTCKTRGAMLLLKRSVFICVGADGTECLITYFVQLTEVSTPPPPHCIDACLPGTENGGKRKTLRNLILSQFCFLSEDKVCSSIQNNV